MSYNIRYDNSGDKDNQWKFRRDFAADLVKFHEADVFGAQEVLNNQLNDLLDFSFVFSDPPGARTQDPNIKSVVLYQLS